MERSRRALQDENWRERPGNDIPKISITQYFEPLKRHKFHQDTSFESGIKGVKVEQRPLVRIKIEEKPEEMGAPAWKFPSGDPSGDLSGAFMEEEEFDEKELFEKEQQIEDWRHNVPSSAGNLRSANEAKTPPPEARTMFEGRRSTSSASGEQQQQQQQQLPQQKQQQQQSSYQRRQQFDPYPYRPRGSKLKKPQKRDTRDLHENKQSQDNNKERSTQQIPSIKIDDTTKKPMVLTVTINQGKEITLEARFKFFHYKLQQKPHGVVPNTWDIKSGIRAQVTLHKDKHNSPEKVLDAIAAELQRRYCLGAEYADFRRWLFWGAGEKQPQALSDQWPHIPLNMVKAPNAPGERKGNKGGRGTINRENSVADEDNISMAVLSQKYMLNCSISSDLGPPNLQDVLLWLEEAQNKGIKHKFNLIGGSLMDYAAQVKYEIEHDKQSSRPYIAEHRDLQRASQASRELRAKQPEVKQEVQHNDDYYDHDNTRGSEDKEDSVLNYDEGNENTAPIIGRSKSPEFQQHDEQIARTRHEQQDRQSSTGVSKSKSPEWSGSSTGSRAGVKQENDDYTPLRRPSKLEPTPSSTAYKSPTAYAIAGGDRKSSSSLYSPAPAKVYTPKDNDKNRGGHGNTMLQDFGTEAQKQRYSNQGSGDKKRKRGFLGSDNENHNVSSGSSEPAAKKRELKISEEILALRKGEPITDFNDPIFDFSYLD